MRPATLPLAVASAALLGFVAGRGSNVAFGQPMPYVGRQQQFVGGMPGASSIGELSYLTGVERLSRRVDVLEARLALCNCGELPAGYEVPFHEVLPPGVGRPPRSQPAAQQAAKKTVPSCLAKCDATFGTDEASRADRDTCEANCKP